MLSNKTLATLLFIILNMELVTSSGIPGPSPSGKLVPLKRRKPTSGTAKNALEDADSAMKPVEIQKESSSEEMNISQKRLVPQVNKFEELIRQEKYGEIIKLGKNMDKEAFLKQLCPVVKTPEQYNEFVSYLKDRKMVVSFYVYGDIEVVKGAILAEQKVYKKLDYFANGNLEVALHLALKEGKHDRVIELFDFRKGMTAENDEQLKRAGKPTSFEKFVGMFVGNLTPWKDGMALKRFLTFHGDELRHKLPDIIDTLCQELVFNLKHELQFQNAKILLTDLIGQSSLLNPMTFAKGFLCNAGDEHRSSFIEYAWRGAIKEALKKDSEWGGEKLWLVMKKKRPGQFPGDYPPTATELDAVLKQFSTKHELEVQWVMKNAPDFMEKFNEFVTCNLFPKVLVQIVFEYMRPTWIDVPTIKSS